MESKKIQGGIIALGLAGLIGLGVWQGNVQRARQAREQAEFSALFNAVNTAQKLAGEATDGPGQTLLDSLGINYRLKDGERVKLDVGSKSAYVNIEKIGSKGYGETRGFADKDTLERYISSYSQPKK